MSEAVAVSNGLSNLLWLLYKNLFICVSYKLQPDVISAEIKPDPNAGLERPSVGAIRNWREKIQRPITTWVRGGTLLSHRNSYQFTVGR